MQSFFHGWRRKMGCVTLVLACLLMGMWTRSLHHKDTLQVQVAETTWHFLVSNQSWIYWQRVFPTTPHASASSSISAYIEPGTVYFGEDANEYHYFDTLCTSKSSFLIDHESNLHLGIEMKVWGVPYWTVVMPLTLLSGWLILWKPRKNTAFPPKPEVPLA